MKIATRITSYVLVLVVGLAIGFYYGSRFGQAHAFAFDMAEISYYSAHMDMQMSEGTDATREEAIHAFLALVEKRSEQSNAFFTKKIIATDSALANARLAALAKKRGAVQEAQQYLNRAVSFCPQMGWKDCSAEKISHMVNQLDKEDIFKAQDTQ
ncbi:MAG: hypothetical protein KDJ99_33065 [Candidatus Competibacteraceae bacterium]|nr:hypothetical protein [Candidatus Competibacteraceae bacterium]